MPKISIVMPCYNAASFLAKSIDSVLYQDFEDWELVIVNDGSTDQSLDIAIKYTVLSNKIRVVSKENGGYVSARLHGLNYISEDSEYLHFYDADDILHPKMLSTLYQLIDKDPSIGAIYCNHQLIDESGQNIGMPSYGVRIVPTLFGVASLKEEDSFTPFISIFCWASRMIEPMTIIRREAYVRTTGWNIEFGKGQGNIGDGVLLFSEIALFWKIYYVHQPLYYYRKHPNQATANSKLNKIAYKKVLKIWLDYSKNTAFSRDTYAAIIFYRYRLSVYYMTRSLKYNLRYNQIKFIILMIKICYKYTASLSLLLYRNSLIFNDKKIDDIKLKNE